MKGKAKGPSPEGCEEFKQMKWLVGEMLGTMFSFSFEVSLGFYYAHRCRTVNMITYYHYFSRILPTSI
jgi:hypothetical protein